MTQSPDRLLFKGELKLDGQTKCVDSGVNTADGGVIGLYRTSTTNIVLYLPLCMLCVHVLFSSRSICLYLHSLTYQSFSCFMIIIMIISSIIRFIIVSKELHDLVKNKTACHGLKGTQDFMMTKPNRNRE